MEQITVISHNQIINDETKQNIQKAVARALDRFAGAIRAVEVKLLDINGPRGGVDKLCTLRVINSQNKNLIIKGKGMSFLQAVHLACGVARNALSRRNGKMRNYRSGSENLLE